jgi:hypothetical protein
MRLVRVTVEAVLKRYGVPLGIEEFAEQLDIALAKLSSIGAVPLTASEVEFLTTQAGPAGLGHSVKLFAISSTMRVHGLTG